MSGPRSSPLRGRGRKESWLLEIEALSERDAREQGGQIARARGYEVDSSSARVERRPVRDPLTGVTTSGSFWVRLAVIER